TDALVLSSPYSYRHPPATPTIYTFPYTTLFRSLRIVKRRHPLPNRHLVDIPASRHEVVRRVRKCQPHLLTRVGRQIDLHRRPRRSEEHTSELQSLAYLVCRLLLEKKKMNTATHR